MFFNEILMNIINRHLICINYNKVKISDFFSKKNIAAVPFTCASTFVQNFASIGPSAAEISGGVKLTPPVKISSKNAQSE